MSGRRYAEDFNMEFYDVIRTRRSIRKYQDKEIPEDVLMRVLDAGRIAPSGSNRQPWRFVVVKDKDKRQQIAEACYGQKFIAEAPVVLVCCSIRCTSGYEPWKEAAGPRDVIIAIDHITLAARNEGLGTCWIGALYPKEVARIVNVPEDIDVIMVLPIGYPLSDEMFTGKTSRKSMEEIVFYEEYGKGGTV